VAVNIWRYLLVDRIAITGVIPSIELYNHVFGQLYTMEAEQAQFLPGGKIIIAPNKNKMYPVRLDYYAEYTYKKVGRRKILDITVGAPKLFGKKTPHRYMTLTLYPSQFQAGEFENFKSVFDTLFDPITYSMLYHTGKVNYLELAADSLSHRHHGFLPYCKYVKVSDIYKSAAAQLGTTYIGSPKSNRFFRIYDKYKQLLDTGKATFTKVFPHTRIEYAVRRLGVTASDLIEMENPFTKLLIADLAKAQVASDDEDWQAFIAESLQNGVPDTLSKRPKNKRKKYLGMLDDRPVSWWNPDDVWNELPVALGRIAP